MFWIVVFAGVVIISLLVYNNATKFGHSDIPSLAANTMMLGIVGLAISDAVRRRGGSREQYTTLGNVATSVYRLSPGRWLVLLFLTAAIARWWAAVVLFLLAWAVAQKD